MGAKINTETAMDTEEDITGFINSYRLDRTGSNAGAALNTEFTPPGYPAPFSCLQATGRTGVRTGRRVAGQAMTGHKAR